MLIAVESKTGNLVTAAEVKKTKQKKEKRVKPSSFLADLNALTYGGWLTEYRFYPGRRCAFDYANPDRLIAIEIEGGLWMAQAGKKSRHFTGSGASSDMKKYNAAEVRGWTVLRYPDNNKALSRKTVDKAIRDVKAILTGIAEGQRTLDSTCTCQHKILSEKFGMTDEQAKQYTELLEAH